MLHLIHVFLCLFFLTNVAYSKTDVNLGVAGGAVSRGISSTAIFESWCRI